MKRQKIALVSLIVVSLGVLALILWQPVIDRVVRRAVVSKLSEKLQADVRLKKLSISLLPPELLIEDLEIRRREGPLQLIKVRRASVVPGAGPIFLGRVSIKRLVVEEPTLWIDLTKSRSEPVTKKKTRFRLRPLSDLIQIEVKEAEVNGIKLRLQLAKENLQVTISNGNARYKGKGAKERWEWKGGGRLYWGTRFLDLDDVQIVAHRLGPQIQLERFELAGLGVRAHAQGTAYPLSDIKVNLRGDLQRAHVALQELGLMKAYQAMRGGLVVKGRVRGAWDRLRYNGDFEGTRLEFKERKIERVSFQFKGDHRKLISVSGEVDPGGGPIARFRLGRTNAKRPGAFEVKVSGLSFAKVYPYITRDSRNVVQSTVDVVVNGRLGILPYRLDGTYRIRTPEVALDLSPNVRRYLPLRFQKVNIQGRFHSSLQKPFVLQEGKVKARGVDGTFRFDFGRKGVIDGDWFVNVTAMGVLFPAGEKIRGAGRVSGGVKARGRDHYTTLDIQLDEFAQKHRRPSHFAGVIAFKPNLTSLVGFRLRTDRGLVSLEGKFPYDDVSPMMLQVSISDFDLGWVADVVSRQYPVLQDLEALGSGILELRGISGALQGNLEIEAEELSYRGEQFERAQLVVDFEDGDLVIQKGEVEATPGIGSVRGVIGDAGFRAFRVDAERFPLRILSLPEIAKPFISHADFQLELNGDVRDPEIEGGFQLLRAGDATEVYRFGEGTLEGRYSDLGWAVNFEEGALRAQGRADLLHRAAFSGEGTFSRLSLSPLLPATNSALSGTWALEGDLRRAASWNGHIVVQEFQVEKGEWEIALAAPVTVSARKGFFEFPQVIFHGEGTELRVDHVIRSDGTMEGAVEGDVALRILTLFPTGILRTEGAAEVHARIGGTVEDPQFTGRIDVADGLLQIRGFPHPIENMKFHASLDQRRIFVDDLEASVAGGNVTMAGELLLSTDEKEARVSMNGNVSRANLRFPRWLPATLSGNLSLNGPLVKPLLRGEFVVHEATYRENWDWKRRILSFRGGARRLKTHRAEEENIRFDVLFRSEGEKFFLKNNIATATMLGELRLTGSDEAIGLVGKIETVEGNISFLDNEFEVVSGLVTFENADTVRPTFDISTKTLVQDTKILLDIRSEEGEVMAFLSSQPPKDETNIVALLTVGVDVDELIGSGNTSQSTSASVLSTALSAPVQSRVETGLRKTRIADSFQLVPYFSQDAKTTGLKMIVGRRLFPTVRLFYSTDLFEIGAENTIKIEQSFNRHVSIQGSVRDNNLEANQETDVGVDLEFKFEF